MCWGSSGILIVDLTFHGKWHLLQVRRQKPCSDGFVCLGRALTFPNPNHQNATGVQPSAFGGFGTHALGTTIQSVVSRLHLQRETCTNGHGKTTSMIPLIIFVFGEFSGPAATMQWRFCTSVLLQIAQVPLSKV